MNTNAVIEYLQNAAKTTPYKIEQDRLNLAIQELNSRLRQEERKVSVDRDLLNNIIGCLELVANGFHDINSKLVQENAINYVNQLKGLLGDKNG